VAITNDSKFGEHKQVGDCYTYAPTGAVWKITKAGGSATANTTATISTTENSTKRATKVLVCISNIIPKMRLTYRLDH
jgi:hypothetical protein